LLVRLRDAEDRGAWAQFVDLYAPLVYEFGRRRGLQDADAADLCQDVLAAVADGIRKFDYDPRRGTFRAWLFTVVVNKFRVLRQRQGRQQQGSGDTTAHLLLHEVPAAADSDAWEKDFRQRLFAWAAEQVEAAVEPATWQAFYRTSVLGIKPADAAKELGLSVAAVYMAKSRVIARMRELIDEAQRET
jgi:RNA polymerase sigma-70 factor (ECF subfamily)